MALNFTETVNLPSFSNNYQGAWQGSRDAQQNQIGTVSAGYQQLIAQQQAAAAANNARWQALKRQTVGGLRGANRANLQDIADKYTAMSGQVSQQMIDRGLGNTTVQQSMQRGISSDQAREATRSRNEFAKTIAGYRSTLGQAQLSAEMANTGATMGLGQNYLGFLGGINIGYPNRGDFESSAGGGGGGGGGYGGSYPAMQGLPRFGSDAIPVTYEMGPSGGFYSGGVGSVGSYGQSPADYAAQVNAGAGGYDSTVSWTPPSNIPQQYGAGAYA